MNTKVLFQQFILASICFLSAQIILGLVLMNLGSNYFNADIWYRWDSAHYISIAQNGYEFFSCSEINLYNDDPTIMCGNAGWFPGYPALIRLVGYIHTDYILMAGIVSKVFYFLTLFLIIRIAEIQKLSFHNVLYGLIAAFSFSFFYSNAIFPISAILLSVVSALYFYRKEKIWLTGLFCMFAATLYPTGILLSGVFFITIIFDQYKSLLKKVKESCIILIGGLIGLFLVFAVFYFTVGEWIAFFQVQAKYAHGVGNPFQNVFNALKNTPILKATNLHFMQFQSILILVGFIVLAIRFILKRQYLNSICLWSFVYITVFLFFPWTLAGQLSIYRSEALLLPYVFLLAETNTKIRSGLLLVLLAINLPMAYLFFTHVLI